MIGLLSIITGITSIVANKDSVDIGRLSKNQFEEARDKAISQKYWLCCGSFDPLHGDDCAKRCHEIEQGHQERCVYGTRDQHGASREPSEVDLLRAENEALRKKLTTVHFVCDRIPDKDGCRFIELENQEGYSLGDEAGEWEIRPDGLAQLVVSISTEKGQSC